MDSLPFRHEYKAPVTDGERLYVYFAPIGVFALGMTGEVLWSREMPPVKVRGAWGTGASPALLKDRLYIVNDNDTLSFIAAFDKQTGKEVWRVRRDEGSNWATPFVWENDRRTEIVTAGTDKVHWCMGIQRKDLRTERGWRYVCACLLAVCQGAVMDDRVLAQTSRFASVATIDGPAELVDVQGKHLYVIADKTLRIFDTSNPSAPERVGVHTFPEHIRAVTVSGSIVYTAADFYGLRVVDASNPAAPVERGSLKMRGGILTIAMASANILRPALAAAPSGVPARSCERPR